MSPQFKGTISLILTILFFFPWVWSGILNIRLSATLSISVTIIVMIATALLGLRARKDGARILGTSSLILASISILISVVNLFSVVLAK